MHNKFSGLPFSVYTAEDSLHCNWNAIKSITMDYDMEVVTWFDCDCVCTVLFINFELIQMNRAEMFA